MSQNTRQIQVGGIAVGGGAPVTVQSMCNTDTRNVAATLVITSYSIHYTKLYEASIGVLRRL